MPARDPIAGPARAGTVRGDTSKQCGYEYIPAFGIKLAAAMKPDLEPANVRGDLAEGADA